MKTADQILKEHEDANEMHFHQVDREWIIKAMEEYARTAQPWMRPQDQMPKEGEPVLITDKEGFQVDDDCAIVAIQFLPDSHEGEQVLVVGDVGHDVPGDYAGPFP